MLLEEAQQFAPTFALIFFRIAGMMLFAPLFGSVRIPRRVRLMLALILTLGLAGGVGAPAALPQSTWMLAVGIGGEMAFGLAMGMVLSLVFIAAQWAGEMIGQQMGLNISEVLDPQFGARGSLIGDAYFMVTLVVFLVFRGHHAMLRGVRDSFDVLPLLSVGMNQGVLDLLGGLLQSCTMLAYQLAAPTLLTMLVVDVALGFVSKTVPQFNVMSAGMSIRAIVGLVVLIAGLTMTIRVTRDAIFDSMNSSRTAWTQRAVAR